VSDGLDGLFQVRESLSVAVVEVALVGELLAELDLPLGKVLRDLLGLGELGLRAAGAELHHGRGATASGQTDCGAVAGDDPHAAGHSEAAGGEAAAEEGQPGVGRRGAVQTVGGSADDAPDRRCGDDGGDGRDGCHTRADSEHGGRVASRAVRVLLEHRCCDYRQHVPPSWSAITTILEGHEGRVIRFSSLSQLERQDSSNHSAWPRGDGGRCAGELEVLSIPPVRVRALGRAAWQRKRTRAVPPAAYLSGQRATLKNPARAQRAVSP
jgi:hypothetical protein